MAITPSNYFDSVSTYIKAQNPPQALIDKLYNDPGVNRLYEVRQCIPKAGGAPIDCGCGEWFWAKLVDGRAGGTVGNWYLVYSKAKNAGNTAYGSKVAAPNPPFPHDQGPIDVCE